jgi:PTH2 family peptidyl-tRNA hydrolase
MIKQVIIVRKDLNMRKGKMCAQVAHASMAFMSKMIAVHTQTKLPIILSREVDEWISKSFAKIVVGVDSEQDLKDLIDIAMSSDILVSPIVDNGATEFHNVPTLTCAAIGPDHDFILDKISGHLKLL